MRGMGKKETGAVTLESLNDQFGLFRIEMHKMNVRLTSVDAGQRKQGVLLEDTQTQLRLILDGYGATNRRVDELEDHMNKGFQDVEFKLDAVIERLDEKVDRKELRSLH
jgi:hypothetical protein